MAYMLAMAVVASVFASPVHVAVHPAAVRTGATTGIGITFSQPLPSDATLQWSTTAGSVQGNQKAGYEYVAPADPGRAFIHLAVNSGGALWAEGAAPVQVYRQFVILKADDFRVSVPDQLGLFLTYINALIARGVKTSVGMIADQCQNPGTEMHDKVVGLARGGFVEFWNHGYDHAHYLPAGAKESFDKSTGGEDTTYPPGTTFEFQGRPYAEQLDHLTRAQQIILDTYGIRMRAFGAPYNKFDASTAPALHALNQVDTWLFGPSEEKTLHVLERGGGEIENGTGMPSLSRFLATYNSARPLLVLQDHPAFTTFQANWSEFSGIIDKIESDKGTFILPGEYVDLTTMEVVPKDPNALLPDPGLECAVRFALNQWTGPVDPAAAAGLTSLQYTGQLPHIKSLMGLGALSGVRHFDFRGNEISDATPLVDFWHGVGAEITAQLQNNPLSDDFTCNQIPLLDADGLHIDFTGPCDNVRLRLAVVGLGTLDPSVGDHVEPRNSPVSVKATPAAGYVFNRWTGDLAGTTTNPATLVVDTAKTVGAVFAPASVTTAAQQLLNGFAAADADHSGGLSFTEAAAAIPGLTQDQFNQMDANGDGQLTQAELNQFLNPGGCTCGKADFTLAGFKGRLADLFPTGLALLVLVALSGRRSRV